VTKARDQDGNWYQGGYDHVIPLERTLLRTGVSIGYYDSEREFTHFAVEASIGGRRELGWDLALDLNASYRFEKYDDPSTFAIAFTSPSHPTWDRKDHVWNFEVELERELARWLTMTVRYQGTIDDSNTPTFEYDRHIVGLFFTVPLGEK
jgi:hypothetical protein